MADFGRGIKAGVITGIIYIAISAILVPIYHSLRSIPDFIYGTGLTPFLLRDLTDFSFVIFSLGSHIIRGIIFGAVFAALYNFLPSVSRIVRGVVLSSFFWIVALIEVIYTAGAGTVYTWMINLSSVDLVLAGIISALVFGALTGFLWGRFRGKELTEEREGRPVLLAGSILGVFIWAPSAALFIIGVVIEGVPAVNPGMWWSDVLATSVVFLGLPGWVLALVACRKVRRGESGLRWGVAGGIMMALTGIMLLPGALAIAGGMFSKGESASGAGTAVVTE